MPRRMVAFGVLALAAVAVSVALARQGSGPASAPAPLGGRSWSLMKLDQGQPLRYALILPDHFVRERAYPVLMALPPGDAGEAMVDVSLRKYWEAEARKRGWVVVSPVAPEGRSFLDSPALLPRLIDDVSRSVSIEGGRVHLAGVSSGGRAAFRAAALSPNSFASLTLLPGCPPTPDDGARASSLKSMRVRFYAGDRDKAWLAQERAALASLRGAGVDASLTVLENQGEPLAIEPADLFNWLESARPGDVREALMDEGALAASRAQMEESLDAFHAALAAGDKGVLASILTPEAVVLGPEANQRFDRAGLVRWAISRSPNDPNPFAGVLKGRTLGATLGGESAWVEEAILSPRLGSLRATGVLVRLAGGWKIAQFHISAGVPQQARPEGAMAGAR